MVLLPFTVIRSQLNKSCVSILLIIVNVEINTIKELFTWLSLSAFIRHLHVDLVSFSFAVTMLTRTHHHILKVAIHAGFMYKVANPAYME